MKIEWIEDFLALIEAGTFSHAAERRHVTQPAFSRRIRQLEEWLGVELIDRQATHLRLTPQGRLHEPQLRDWLARLYALRSRMRAEAIHGRRAVLTTQHTLTVSYLPRLLRYFRHHAPDARLQVRSSNRADCINDFERGEADLMVCSELQGMPLLTERRDIERLELGQEQLIPVSATDHAGRPLHEPHPYDPLPLIGYDRDSFLGSALATPFMFDIQRRFDIELVCETAFTIGIKELALSGLGIGWLPHGLIEGELESGKLVSLLDVLGGPMLAVAGYRHTTQSFEAAERLWALMQEAPPAV
ncbi:DNA-binding transcriptional regulator, LysR family [Modicisalibacter ilicicola DSM 19980]|uniref:DNA-binding transcriptional regulator, LysR family n=1 Tax=Modicisalibacter ilicicola DSM 19980 TaxID=1121942 RepID=A0A1M4UA58_9GAMM|nr:LysR substrate-binding domain-containing protein [Halomonas ilicicola]SHE53453.1 DNA-binding transcriptional regulator, LysR family [Halomonas ilicicola DSM 19980]